MAQARGDHEDEPGVQIAVDEAVLIMVRGQLHGGGAEGARRSR